MKRDVRVFKPQYTEKGFSSNPRTAVDFIPHAGGREMSELLHGLKAAFSVQILLD